MEKQNLSTKVKKQLKREIEVREVDQDLLRRCAYEIFEERNQQNIPGDHLSDWLKAEKELKTLVIIK